MLLFPKCSFGLLNIWWYPLFYGVVSVLVMNKISKHKKKRILTFPKYKKIERNLSQDLKHLLLEKY